MYEQGEILLIPIPFSDLTSNKKRPVLVLSKLVIKMIQLVSGVRPLSSSPRIGESNHNPSKFGMWRAIQMSRWWKLERS
jgi:hypothetical protein